MEKEALITVILNDLKEVETLVRTFNSPKQINPAFFRLTLQKIASIKQEIELLEDLEPDELPSQTIKSDKSNQLSATKQLKEEVLIQEPEVAQPINRAISIDEPTPKVEIKSETIKSDPLIIEDEIILSDDDSIDQTIEIKISEPSSTPKPDVKHTSTLGELMGKDITSVADKLGSSNDNNNKLLIGKPVDDIKKAIGINDRFMFQRELFDGKESVMNQTLNELNQLETFEAAELFLKSNFDWDFQSDVVETFLKTIHRKFIS